MPSLRPLRNYPQEFKEILLAASLNGSWTKDLRDIKSARTLRNHLYNYRQVLRGEALRSSAQATKLAIIFDSISFAIEGTTLIVYDGESQTLLTDTISNRGDRL